jgi:hypothetical protein
MHQTQGCPSTLKKKQTLMALRALIDTNTGIVGDLNTPLSEIDRSSRQKYNKKNFRATPHISPNRHG